MRGTDEQQEWMFSYISAEKRVPKDHPLRAIRTMVDVIFKEMSPQFESLYSKTGRTAPVVIFVAATIPKNPQISTSFDRVDHNSLKCKYLKIGCLAEWRESARLLPWAQEVSGSNPDAPTILGIRSESRR
jgi:hypothetical protein